jgi:hypothetical protein
MAIMADDPDLITVLLLLPAIAKTFRDVLFSVSFSFVGWGYSSRQS